jgi:PleD family two-component response regulator
VQRAVEAESFKGSKRENGDEITNKHLQMALNSNFELEQQVYHAFNKDLKKRLHFISNIIEWDDWADVLIDGEMKPQKAAKKQWLAENGVRKCADGEMANEHFSSSKSDLQLVMEKVFFPVIDVQEHD